MSTIASIRLADLLTMSWSSIRRNRLRSVLTIGAIAFGIAIMMYLISLGFGLERITLGGVEGSAALLSLSVNAASEELQPITHTSIEKIQALPRVKQVLPQVTVKGELTLSNTKAQVTVIGVDPDYLGVDDATRILVGHTFRADDVQTMVVTTGFLKQFGLDQGKNPLVVFSLKYSPSDYPAANEISNVNVSGVIDAPASAVYLPRAFLEASIPNFNPHYQNVKVTVGRLDDIEPTKNDLIKRGFRVTTVSETINDIKKVFSWIRYFLGALGMIAIFVAGIGMFNTLTISLLERTKEIGIMKALGVRKVDIMRLFLVESFLMGILGGIFGIASSFFMQKGTLFVFSLIASLLPSAKVPNIFVNPWYLVLAFFVLAVSIAGFTGIYPARRASRLNPIDAIRYE